ncbi:MAG TPA: PRC-barrel domain containing protein [Sphingomicrobium sp.]|nr:PRC-barrel domain containing protein [Sphingomicrobium sp.]
MADTISWMATIATILGASMTAANLGSRITGYGFVAFTFGAICWIAVGAASHQPALMWTNVVLLGLDAFGIWRWLGRQSRVEEGARAATKQSEETPGEALFPVSLLSRAAVDCGGEQIGHCVDAMAGCRSGQIDYVVVSEGGVAGLGETLRRLSWTAARVDGEKLTANLSRAAFQRLERLSRDQWPGR